MGAVTDSISLVERMRAEKLRESDPRGKNPHEPGAKLDAGKNRVGLMVSDFPRALEAVAEVATYGANKYTPHGWVSVPDGLERYTDAMHRHLLAEARGEKFDAESGLEHAAKIGRAHV